MLQALLLARNLRLSIVAIIACFSFPFAATDAHAHARLVKSTPAAGATVPSPSEIRLEFSEGVEPRFSSITLTGANGATAPLGSAAAEGSDRTMLVVPVVKPLAQGVYKAHWHAVSVDTHRTQGTFEFTVK